MRNLRAPQGGAERIPSGQVLPPLPSSTWLWAKRLLLALLLSISLSYLPYRLYLRSGLARYLALREELARLREENARVRRDNRRLLMEISRLGGDEGAIERVARDELGLIRPGEIVFKVEEDP